MGNSLYGPIDPAEDAGYSAPPPRMGFFTDTSVCIGCKACEVACKTWNNVPDDGFNLLGHSYDNTGGLTANSWRHVAFIEQPVRGSGAFLGMPTGPSSVPATNVVAARHGAPTGTEPGIPPAVDALAAAATAGTDFVGSTSSCGGASSSGCGARSGGAAPSGGEFIGMPMSDLPGKSAPAPRTDFRWLMMSNVCKHCTHAGCLDVCPTGALFRTEFGTVVVQDDICNGCGYCISGCPYGVIDRREDDGRAWKCTLCYDRLGDGQTPACAKACPTESIQYGELDELRQRAAKRVEQLHEAGVPEAKLYGESPDDGVGGDGAFFLLLDEPEVYGLPPDPHVPTRDLPAMWKRAGLAALTMAATAVVAFAGRRG
ncbi:ferredoxin [Paractinoplanes abujensis]|uniref:Formate dehydrogenase iron-sulfur subunit n=1 Tax=Paractinoplanes abujensis TaxID=882441 RepID=A0A7W7CKD5_9ACTN|nr:4Fe-4S dicluster domain-containing protein [Actinoplanes abujensis]MBB4690166.1 formate dehydrogenase iron-sulfur subunit [Actinoplanes abujensis]GID20933.1 ferredoxin [Actinoplanes abujensis]